MFPQHCMFCMSPYATILALIFTHREFCGFFGGPVCDSRVLWIFIFCGYLTYWKYQLTQDDGTGRAKMLTSYRTLLRNHVHMTFSINRKLFKLTTWYNVLTAKLPSQSEKPQPPPSVCSSLFYQEVQICVSIRLCIWLQGGDRTHCRCVCLCTCLLLYVAYLVCGRAA